MLHRLDILAIDVEQNYVLSVRRAKPPAAVLLRKLSQNPQLLAGCSATDERHPNIVKRVVSLPMNAQMRPVASSNRRSFRLVSAAKLPSKLSFDLIPKARYLPLL